MTDNVLDCNSTDPADMSYMVTQNSMNVKQIGKCAILPPGTGTASDHQKVYAALTPEACANLTGVVTGASWVRFTHAVAAPDCIPAMWSRVNHLGNGPNFNQPNQYNWTIPAMSNLGAYTLLLGQAGAQIAKCAIRLRYNISTDDYDPRNTNASQNNDPGNGVVSPVLENPTVDIGISYLEGLKLAINTDQFGRTFQDRSHTMYLKDAPASVGCSQAMYNLNVRGKRGNIVQTYPAVEYDFQPNQMEVKAGDCVHFQWTGSNTHNNGNPAGDGQAGDAGEGTEGTDRHNVVCLGDRSRNYPVALDQTLHNDSCFFLATAAGPNAAFWGPDQTVTYMNVQTWNSLTPFDAAIWLASSGFYTGKANATASTTQLDVLLDNATPSLAAGVIMKPTATGHMFHYMCTRNNNFSNRSQKGSIHVN